MSSNAQADYGLPGHADAVMASHIHSELSSPNHFLDKEVIVEGFGLDEDEVVTIFGNGPVDGGHDNHVNPPSGLLFHGAAHLCHDRSIHRTGLFSRNVDVVFRNVLVHILLGIVDVLH